MTTATAAEAAALRQAALDAARRAAEQAAAEQATRDAATQVQAQQNIQQTLQSVGTDLANRPPDALSGPANTNGMPQLQPGQPPLNAEAAAGALGAALNTPPTTQPGPLHSRYEAEYGIAPVQPQVLSEPNVVGGRPPEQIAALSQATQLAAPAERAALDQLAQVSPEARAQYDQLRNTTLCDPASTAALQSLLLRQDSPLQSQDLVGGGTLLDHLGSLTGPNANLAPELAPQQQALTGQLLQELATPQAMDQGPRGTCVPTATLVALARENPAEYARIVSGLASPSGQVTLADRTTVLTREPHTAVDDGLGRSIPTRLASSALMELGNGTDDYTNLRPETLEAKRLSEGTSNENGQMIMQAVFGRPFELLTAPEGQFLNVDELRTSVAEGRPTLAGLIWGDENNSVHGVAVTGFDREGDQEYVRYTNSLGGTEERLRLDEFQSRLISGWRAAP